MQKALYSFREVAALLTPPVRAMGLPKSHRLSGLEHDTNLALQKGWRIYFHAAHDMNRTSSTGLFGNRVFVNEEQKTLDLFTGNKELTLDTSGLFCLAYGLRDLHYKKHVKHTVSEMKDMCRALAEIDAASHAVITAGKRFDYRSGALDLPPLLAAARGILDGKDGHPGTQDCIDITAFYPTLYKDAGAQRVLQAAQLRSEDPVMAALTRFLYDHRTSNLTSVSLFLKDAGTADKENPFQSYLGGLKELWRGFAGSVAVQTELNLFRELKLLAADFIFEEITHPATAAATPQRPVVLAFDRDFRAKAMARRRAATSEADPA